MPRLLRQSGFATLVILSLGIAGYAIFVYSVFPVGAMVHPAMRSSFELHRLGVYAHVFAAAMALLLGPFQFMSKLRARRPQVHRLMGRLYLGIGVAVGGVSGLYLAFHAFGGAVSRFGFGCLAISWLFTGLRAYVAIRARDTATHRRWMVRNFALAFAAVTLRLYVPGSLASGIAFETAYPVIAWACWIPNLVAAELLFNRTRNA